MLSLKGDIYRNLVTTKTRSSLILSRHLRDLLNTAFPPGVLAEEGKTVCEVSINTNLDI